MNINSVSSLTHANQYAGMNVAPPENEGSTKATPNAVSAVENTTNSDSFTQSRQEDRDEFVTYTPPARLSQEQVQAIKEQINQSMLDFAEKLLGKQAEKAGGTVDLSALAEKLGLGTTPEAAQKAISEDGMWGVNAVATRLMDMAISLSGGDAEKAELLRAAVQKGFDQVGGLWGGELPQVSQDTYTETMNRFDYWSANGSMEGYGETGESEESAPETEPAGGEA